MSTTRPQPTPSSPTPSKSSLRRTSGAPQQHSSSQRNLIPSPSPHFEDNSTREVRYSPRSPPNQTLDYNSDEDEDEDDEDEDEGPDPPVIPRGASYFPRSDAAAELIRPFQPLFILVEDSLTAEHYHPSVHYIFADDDNEIVTEAAVRSLAEEDLDSSSTTAHARNIIDSRKQGLTESEEEQEDRYEEHVTTTLPPIQPGVQEHYLVLDVQSIDNAHKSQTPFLTQGQSQSQAMTTQSEGPMSRQVSQHQASNSFAVTRFTSLSPEWQITSANITSAPTMSDTPDFEDEGLMLRIEGRGFPPLDASDLNIGNRPRDKDLSTAATTSEQDPQHNAAFREHLEELIGRFQSRLGDIRRLMDIDVPTIGLLPPDDAEEDVPDEAYGAEFSGVGRFDEQD